MGTRERVIIELVCDLCKKTIKRGPPLVGQLSLKPNGRRGRAKSHEVAFHPGCADKLVETA